MLLKKFEKKDITYTVKLESINGYNDTICIYGKYPDSVDEFLIGSIYILPNGEIALKDTTDYINIDVLDYAIDVARHKFTNLDILLQIEWLASKVTALTNIKNKLTPDSLPYLRYDAQIKSYKEKMDKLIHEKT